MSAEAPRSCESLRLLRGLTPETPCAPRPSRAGQLACHSARFTDSSPTFPGVRPPELAGPGRCRAGGGCWKLGVDSRFIRPGDPPGGPAGPPGTAGRHIYELPLLMLARPLMRSASKRWRSTPEPYACVPRFGKRRRLHARSAGQGAAGLPGRPATLSRVLRSGLARVTEKMVVERSRSVDRDSGQIHMRGYATAGRSPARRPSCRGSRYATGRACRGRALPSPALGANCR